MIQLVSIIVYILVVLLCVVFVWKLLVAFSRFHFRPQVFDSRSLHDLPSVSVCIPARNETHAMTACLERVVASTYPKLEIIVLDDSSVDDTSILIKSFAHAGVRFVEGSPLPEGWLGKNHAFESLRREASGRYLLYMDVDTQIQPQTITQLVAYMAETHAAMVSVLPQRMNTWRLNVIFSGLRYFWVLLLHRRSAPAVASNAWMIDRQVLDEEIGGFAQYRLNVQPEGRIAAVLSRRSVYRFVIGTPELGISYEKLYSSFVETNIRLLYPMAGGRPLPGVLALVVLLLLSSPVLVLAATICTGWTLYQAMALWQLALFGAIYTIYLSYVWRRGWWLGIVIWPIALVQDLILFSISVLKYLNGSVTWKGRPVFAPKVVRRIEE